MPAPVRKSGIRVCLCVLFVASVVRKRGMFSPENSLCDLFATVPLVRRVRFLVGVRAKLLVRLVAFVDQRVLQLIGAVGYDLTDLLATEGRTRWSG